ncbi:MAG: hypothetical protein JWP88_1754 [Flaviaesturariibacter sp.]|nr:hypothetical protein [Flaviaesturariibacter sp.]
MKYLLFTLLAFAQQIVFSQGPASGILGGSVMDDKKKALEGASVQLIALADSSQRKTTLTDKSGEFHLDQISFGYYKVRISYVGFQSITLDSINFRADRFDFNLNDIVLPAKNSSNLDEVIVYAEKPLVQSKDGNITFNAAESALSAGSNASELLTNVPLITKDPNGKLLVRGKEPKILIDDKPVELNQQQLQDLLESLPGSAIEKIEVMTNPPPQYANEQGGVINITTRKGRVGKSGRINLSAGTRGEASLNGNFNYRKNAFALNMNAGIGYNRFNGGGYSNRQNYYGDSIRYYNASSNENGALRPNFRVNADYDFNKLNAISATLSYNQNVFDNNNETEYDRFNRFNGLYYLSNRLVNSTGGNYNPNLSLSYTHKTKLPGETLKVIASGNISQSDNLRDFYEQYLNPVNYSFTGQDSAQRINSDNLTKGYNIRVAYDRPLKNKKTFISTGAFYNSTHSDIEADATYKRKSDGKWLPLSTLTNQFAYAQSITNLRGSVRQVLGKDFSATVGLSAEQTGIHFNLYKTGLQKGNNYWSYLPFGNINKNWRDVLNVTLSYRRSIRRPGVTELNPTIDSSDQYNIRSGNPDLMPSLTHNFDLVLGKNKKDFYVNLGLGYNVVEDVFNQLRVTPTEITWQNISSKKEYEVSTWSGYTLSKKTRLNLSASYTYNQYSAFDKTVRKFRNGGSFTSNLNMNQTWKELYSATGSFTYNRFANPQGKVRSTVSMNIGFQAKMLAKKLTATINFIDPFGVQQSKSFTYGTNFTIESLNSTQTRNIRLSLSYNLAKAPPKKKPGGNAKQQVQKLLPAAKSKQ